jgi:transcriptional regulator with XRE-family HTH domain
MTRLENKLEKNDSTNYSEDLPQHLRQSTNLTSRKMLIRRLRKGRSARIRFVESHLNKKLAFQIRSLRGDLSQEQMEDKVGIKQQVLSRLENPYYGKSTMTTLKKIAAGCDVALLVEFVPFSQLVNRVSGTPYIERGLSPDTMNVPDYAKEEGEGKFSEVDRMEVPADNMGPEIGLEDGGNVPPPWMTNTVGIVNALCPEYGQGTGNIVPIAQYQTQTGKNSGDIGDAVLAGSSEQKQPTGMGGGSLEDVVKLPIPPTPSGTVNQSNILAGGAYK